MLEADEMSGSVTVMDVTPSSLLLGAVRLGTLSGEGTFVVSRGEGSHGWSAFLTMMLLRVDTRGVEVKPGTESQFWEERVRKAFQQGGKIDYAYPSVPASEEIRLVEKYSAMGGVGLVGPMTVSAHVTGGTEHHVRYLLCVVASGVSCGGGQLHLAGFWTEAHEEGDEADVESFSLTRYQAAHRVGSKVRALFCRSG